MKIPEAPMRDAWKDIETQMRSRGVDPRQIRQYRIIFMLGSQTLMRYMSEIAKVCGGPANFARCMDAAAKEATDFQLEIADFIMENTEEDG